MIRREWLSDHLPELEAVHQMSLLTLHHTMQIFPPYYLDSKRNQGMNENRKCGGKEISGLE